MASKSGAGCQTGKKLEGSGNGSLSLADGEFSFSITLETMALKKQKSREVFEEIQKHLKTALADPAFVQENSTFFEQGQMELDILIE